MNLVNLEFMSVAKLRLFLVSYICFGTYGTCQKKVAKHTRTLREGSRGACACEAFALFAY